MKKKNDRTPLWLEGKTVNEVLFCQEFLAEHPMVNVGNAFFTKDGIGPDENMMKKMIYEELKSVFYKKRNEKENPVWGHGKSGVVKTVKFFTET